MATEIWLCVQVLLFNTERITDSLIIWDIEEVKNLKSIGDEEEKENAKYYIDREGNNRVIENPHEQEWGDMEA